MYMYSGVYHDVTFQSISSMRSSPFMIGSMIAVPFICKKLGLEKLIRYSLLIGGAICGVLFGMHMVMDVHPLIHGVILGEKETHMGKPRLLKMIHTMLINKAVGE